MSENIAQNQDLQNFISRLSEVEPNAYREEIYHEYQNLISSSLITIDPKTIEFVTAPVIHNRPLTPKLFINLDKHIDSSGNLDEGALRQTVSVSIRLLDSCLDAIEMEETIASLVYGSRKIAVCLDGFENYMKLAGSGKSIGGEIDHIGEIVSLSAYQSSITLADEKGECLMWDRFDTKISQKQYEYWHNEETGDMLTSKEIYDNLEDILTDYGTDDIMDTPWRIVPRRNSHILGYGLTTDDVWAKWGDRLESNLLTADQHKDKIFGSDSVYASGKDRTEQNNKNEESAEAFDGEQGNTLDKTEGDFSGAGIFDSKYADSKYAPSLNGSLPVQAQEGNSNSSDSASENLGDSQVNGENTQNHSKNPTQEDLKAEQALPLVMASNNPLIKKKPVPTIIGGSGEENLDDGSETDSAENTPKKSSKPKRHNPVIQTGMGGSTDGFSLPEGDIYDNSISMNSNIDNKTEDQDSHSFEQGTNFFNGNQSTKQSYLDNPEELKDISKESNQDIPQIYADHGSGYNQNSNYNKRTIRNQGLPANQSNQNQNVALGDSENTTNESFPVQSHDGINKRSLNGNSKSKEIFKNEFGSDEQAMLQSSLDQHESDSVAATEIPDSRSTNSQNPYQNIEEKGNWFTNLFGFGRSSKKQKEEKENQEDSLGLNQAVSGLNQAGLVGALDDKNLFGTDNFENQAQIQGQIPNQTQNPNQDQRAAGSKQEEYQQNPFYNANNQNLEANTSEPANLQNYPQNEENYTQNYDQPEFDDEFGRDQSKESLKAQMEEEIEAEKYLQIPKDADFTNTEKLKNGRVDFSNFQNPEAKNEDLDDFSGLEAGTQSPVEIKPDINSDLKTSSGSNLDKIFDKDLGSEIVLEPNSQNTNQLENSFENLQNLNSQNLTEKETENNNTEGQKLQEYQNGQNQEDSQNQENRYSADSSIDPDLVYSDKSLFGGFDSSAENTPESDLAQGGLENFDGNGLGSVEGDNYPISTNRFEVGELVKYLGDGKFYQIDDIQNGDYTLVDDQENLIVAKESELLETDLGEILQKVNHLESQNVQNQAVNPFVNSFDVDPEKSENYIKIQELEIENESLRQTIAESQEKIKTLEAEIENFKNLDLELQKELQSLKEEKSLLEGQIRSLEDQLAETKAENQKLIGSLEKSKSEQTEDVANPFLAGAAGFGLGSLASNLGKGGKNGNNSDQVSEENQDSDQKTQSEWDKPELAQVIADKESLEKQNLELKTENENLRKELEETRLQAQQIEQKQKAENQTESQQKDSIIESLKRQIAQIQMDAVRSSNSNTLNNQNPDDKIALQNLKNKLYFETISQDYKQTNMSKYSLQLQQIVKSNLFQDVIVSINYDGDGPKLVSVESDKFDPSIKHSIDTVMGVVNLGLSKGITPKEMAEQMEIEPRDDNVNETDISHILKLVASSLKQAPAKSNQINPEILNRIAPEMIKDFTQTIKTTVIQLGKGASSTGDDSKPRFSFFGRGDDQAQTQPLTQEVASETSSNTQDTKPADDNSYQYTDQNQPQYQQNQTQSGYDDGYAQPENNNPYGNSQAQAPQAQNSGEQNANTQNANQNQDQEQTQTEESGHGRRSFFSGFGRH